MGDIVNACSNWEPESMHARMWGGLLQDTVSPMGDVVHFYLAKASFLQDMLLGMFVFFFFYVIIGVERVFSHNKPYTYITSLV